MTARMSRGACPALLKPMETGDGLLVRLVPAGPMHIDAFIGLCAAARTYGNGAMEISARGSIQVRGLTQRSAPLFADAVLALGMDLNDGVPVIADPLPRNPSAVVDSAVLAGELRRAIATAALPLAPKVSIAVDGGGSLHLDALKADIRLRAAATAAGPWLQVALAGDAASATSLGLAAPCHAAALVLRLLGVIAAHGPEARASDVLQDAGAASFRPAGGGLIEPAIEPPPRPRAETIGLHRLAGEDCAIGVALAFGFAAASDLMELARIAQVNGARFAATAPGRTILFGPFNEMTGFVLATAADHLGFVVDARDPRRHIVACPGAPLCASGLIAARAIAAELASHLRHANHGVAVHVSGCAKGCAHPLPAPLTIVGTERGCGIVRGGTARERPEAYAGPGDLIAEAERSGSTARETADA